MHMDILKLCIYQSQRRYDQKNIETVIITLLGKERPRLESPKSPVLFWDQ
jgi:hypothetical protein